MTEIHFPDAVKPKNRAPKQRTDTSGQLTEMDVAAVLEHRLAGSHLYENRSKSWYIADAGGIWQPDETGSTFRTAQGVCKETGPSFQKLKKVQAVETLARSAPNISRTSDDFDPDPYVLGTPAGPVDLRTGELMPPDPALMITMSTTVAPDRSCAIPNFTRFLDQVTAGDCESVRFYQQWFGYCLTGDTREQKMIFAYGPGRNGKGVLNRAVAETMGSYAHRAQVETFTAGSADRHPTDIAGMRGKRLVYCSETERNRKWAESKIKDVTGGDKLSARRMRQDFFEFQPRFKLAVFGNYEPAIETADPAMRNRFFVVPFDRVFEGAAVDQHLDKKLEAERPGILAWLIAGCLDWQRNGFHVPNKVREATDAYFDRQDVFAHWLAQETCPGDGLQDTNARLFKSWQAFAKDSGEEPGNDKTFAERMNRCGFKGPHPTRMDGKSVRVYRGLQALSQ